MQKIKNKYGVIFQLVPFKTKIYIAINLHTSLYTLIQDPVVCKYSGK